MSNAGKVGGEWNDPANIGPKRVDFSKMRPRRNADALLSLCVCGVADDGLAYHTQACPAYVAGHRTACEGGPLPEVAAMQEP